MYNKGLKIINKKGKEKNDKIAQKVIEHCFGWLQQLFQHCNAVLR